MATNAPTTCPSCRRPICCGHTAPPTVQITINSPKPSDVFNHIADDARYRRQIARMA